MCGPRTVAVFDFDGTLSRGDCVVPFLRRVAGTGPMVVRLAASPRRFASAMWHRDRDLFKAAAAHAVFAGRSVDDVAPLGIAFADEVVARGLRDDVLGRFQHYRADGARVLIVSASFEVYLATIGERLGADAVLGTRLEVRDGRFTGRFDGANCRAAEKVRRLDSWFTANAIARDQINVHAYGDSTGDLAMLAAADHAWWAGRHTLAPWSAS